MTVVSSRVGRQELPTASKRGPVARVVSMRETQKQRVWRRSGPEGRAAVGFWTKPQASRMQGPQPKSNVKLSSTGGPKDPQADRLNNLKSPSVQGSTEPAKLTLGREDLSAFGFTGCTGMPWNSFDS